MLEDNTRAGGVASSQDVTPPSFLARRRERRGKRAQAGGAFSADRAPAFGNTFCQRIAATLRLPLAQM